MFLAAVGLNVLLVLLELALHPAVLGGDRVPVVLADLVVLVAYGGVSQFLLRSGVGGLARGTLLGSLAGLVLFANLGVEYFGNLPGPAGPMAFFGSISVACACFAASGARQRGAGLGGLAGAWSGMTAMLLLWPLAWALNGLFETRIEAILSGDLDYTRGNSLKEFPAYVAWNTLSAALSHAVVLPLLGAAFGALGAAVRERMKPFAPRPT